MRAFKDLMMLEIGGGVAQKHKMVQEDETCEILYIYVRLTLEIIIALLTYNW